MTEPTAEVPDSNHPAGGLHSAGLVVAVVGLVASIGAYWVASRESANTREERIQEVADQVTDQVADVLADIEALVSGVEGTLVATGEANEEEVANLLSFQVQRADLITSTALLRAEEGSNLDWFGQAGPSRFLDRDVLSADPGALTGLLAELSAVPPGKLVVLDRTEDGGGVAVSLATAFTTHPGTQPRSEAWVVQLELVVPAELVRDLTAGLSGDPVIAVSVGADGEGVLLSPDPPLGTAAATRSFPLLADQVRMDLVPTAEVLDDGERLVPLLFFLAGLALTTVLTPLVSRLGRRREEVRSLSAQRDELDLALTTSRQIEGELRASEQRFRSVLQSSPDIVLWIDPEHATVQILNREELFGHPADEVATIDALLALTHPDDLGTATDGLDRLRLAAPGAIAEMQCRLGRGGGGWEWVQVRGGRVQRDDGSSGSILAVLTTITEQKLEEARRAHLEAQLVQSQRLEAIGQLAGGVAHDFNNILAAIVSGAELVIDDVDGQAREDVEEIRRTARRGSDLARQLLLFSRRDRGSAPEVVDVNAVIGDVETMLGRALDERVSLHFDLTANPNRVHIDPSQIERILMNLTVNARDAMPPEGGSILISTVNLEVAAGEVGPWPGAAGQYLVLSVADTGSGMPEDVRRHAFEPFFSTKEIGKGTGLGLATVYGIVQGAQGHIEVDSAPGEGTTLRIYLPRSSVDAPEEAAPAGRERPEGGSERILLVEDEEGVRVTATRLLERWGYQVDAVASGEEGLAAAERTTADLLLTDVLMPGGMDGRAAARQVRAVQPGLAVLYMTGHSDDVLDDIGIDDDEGEALILRKPFSEDELLRAVRVALSPRSAPPEEPVLDMTETTTVTTTGRRR